MEAVTDPGTLWKKFVQDLVIQDSLRDQILKEIKSSEYWQSASVCLHSTEALIIMPELSYENPPNLPSFESSLIDWEQSLVAGHPTHPVSLVFAG
jgi:siderophore synthetase component